MRHTVVLFAFVCCIGATSVFAQAQKVQQSQNVHQAGQSTQDIQQYLAMLEEWHAIAPQDEQASTIKPANTADAGTLPSSPEPSVSEDKKQGLILAVSADDKSSPAPASSKDSSTSSTKPSTAPTSAPADEKDKEKVRLDIYGFAQLDMGYDFNTNDPLWFDVMRPTKLPAFAGEFGHDGNFYSGVRQTRFGVKGFFQTPLGELKTIFEWELFGVGVDAGQTTFRLRHAWGELGPIGAGQSWSPFMDPDVFPNSLEYWGPNGMVFFRNVQVRWMPINKGNHQLWFAVERPGASGDLGTVASRVELQHIQGRFPAPDISARFRWGGQRFHVQLAGIARYIAWDDLQPVAPFNFSGNAWGWGVNASSVVPVAKKDALKLQITYGHGDENYMNDAPVDIAPIATPTNLIRPINGQALPVLGIVAFYDHYWGEKFSTSVGYSEVKIDNSPLELPSDFHKGQYALVNLLSYPAKDVMIGAEFQWGQRNNFADGFVATDRRIQFGFRYNFDFKFNLGKP